MAALTDEQIEAIYFYTGWVQRWVQVNTALEQAVARIAMYPAQAARITNAIDATPSGILAQLTQLHDVTIPAAFKRLKALGVGSIKLSGSGELNELARQGQRLVGALCSILGVERDADIFRPGAGGRSGSRMGGTSSNCVVK